MGAHYLRNLSCVKHNLRPFVIMVHFGQPALKIVVGTCNDTERGVRGSLKDARSVHIKDGVHRNPDQTRHDLTKINAFDLLVELGQLLLIVSARKEGGTQTYTEPRQPFARCVGARVTREGCSMSASSLLGQYVELDLQRTHLLQSKCNSPRQRRESVTQRQLQLPRVETRHTMMAHTAA